MQLLLLQKLLILKLLLNEADVIKTAIAQAWNSVDVIPKAVNIKALNAATVK